MGQRRAEKEAHPSKRSFMRRAEKEFGQAFHKVGDWIEAGWRALLVSLRIGGAAETDLSEEEYEEAETYRDKNAVELQARLPEAAARQGGTRKEASACGPIRYCCSRVRHALRHSN